MVITAAIPNKVFFHIEVEDAKQNVNFESDNFEFSTLVKLIHFCSEFSSASIPKNVEKRKKEKKETKTYMGIKK